jgi:hypothetical protein
MSQPQPIRFSVPEEGFDLSLLPEAARQRGREVFREAVTSSYKDAYREACHQHRELSHSRWVLSRFRKATPVSAERPNPAFAVSTWSGLLGR